VSSFVIDYIFVVFVESVYLHIVYLQGARGDTGVQGVDGESGIPVSCQLLICYSVIQYIIPHNTRIKRRNDMYRI